MTISILRILAPARALLAQRNRSGAVAELKKAVARYKSAGNKYVAQ